MEAQELAYRKLVQAIFTRKVPVRHRKPKAPEIVSIDGVCYERKKMKKMAVKVKDGKLDIQDLEGQIKKQLPGHSEFSFSYSGNWVTITAHKDNTPKGMVDMYMFDFFEKEKQCQQIPGKQ